MKIKLNIYLVFSLLFFKIIYYSSWYFFCISL